MNQNNANAMAHAKTGSPRNNHRMSEHELQIGLMERSTPSREDKLSAWLRARSWPSLNQMLTHMISSRPLFWYRLDASHDPRNIYIKTPYIPKYCSMVGLTGCNRSLPPRPTVGFSSTIVVNPRRGGPAPASADRTGCVNESRCPPYVKPFTLAT